MTSTPGTWSEFQSLYFVILFNSIYRCKMSELSNLHYIASTPKIYFTHRFIYRFIDNSILFQNHDGTARGIELPVEVPVDKCKSVISKYLQLVGKNWQNKTNISGARGLLVAQLQMKDESLKLGIESQLYNIPPFHILSFFLTKARKRFKPSFNLPSGLLLWKSFLSTSRCIVRHESQVPVALSVLKVQGL